MQGLVIGQISNDYEVQTEKEKILCKPRGKLKKEIIFPVVGDRVEVEEIEKGIGVIEEVLARRNYMKRPKISNITQMVLVISSKMPKPDLLLLDKQLAYLEWIGIEPLIVLNKVDLKQVEEIKQIYEKIGYPVLLTSAKEGLGIEKLRKHLQRKISAFAGNSGVGKSSLLNCLCKEYKTEQGEISKKNQRGKNTTTAVKLYPLEKNTYIADTPGFSTFSVEEIPYRELDQYFKEFRDYIVDCKYVGCTHLKEQDCGVKHALQEGKITKERYENYKKIYEELKDKEEHKW